jgi:hypothetical protein
MNHGLQNAKQQNAAPINVKETQQGRDVAFNQSHSVTSAMGIKDSAALGAGKQHTTATRDRWPWSFGRPDVLNFERVAVLGVI